VVHERCYLVVESNTTKKSGTKKILSPDSFIFMSIVFVVVAAIFYYRQERIV
jgi:hypothetical protein